MKNAMILAGVFVFIIILSIIDIFKQRKETVTYEERLKELDEIIIGMIKSRSKNG